MKASAALAGGLAGTVRVASIHEALRRMTPMLHSIDEVFLYDQQANAKFS